MARAQQHLRRTRHDPTACFAQLFLAMEHHPEPLHQDLRAHLRGVKYLPTFQRDCKVPLPPKWQEDLQQDWALLLKEWHEAGLPERLDDGIYQSIKERLDQDTAAWLHATCPREDPTELWLRSVQDSVDNQQSTEGEAAWAFTRWATLHLDVHFDGWDNPVDIQTLEKAATDLAKDMQVEELLQRKYKLVHRQPPAIPPLPEPGPGNRGHRVNRDGPPRITYGLPHSFLQCLGGQKLLSEPPLPAMPILYDQTKDEYTVLVCHFFSGQRRVEDCHWHLERSTLQFHKKIHYLVLSLDTAVSETTGNLDRGGNWSTVEALLDAGITAFGLSGPPCETYSAARHILPPTEESKWPRPLRSPALLWGLPQLRCREIRQLTVGSRLLLHSTWMETMVCLKGGASLMEHPLERDSSEVPSAWRAPIMQGLMSFLPGYRCNKIEQWRYGAAGIKPTAIRTIACDRPWQVLQDHHLPGLCRPEVRLAGLNEEGEWRTAAAKTYPPQLCKALAAIAHRTVQTRLKKVQYRVCHWHSLPDFLADWIVKAGADSHCITNATRRPGYQG